jgi:hypothetical protein
VFPIELTCMTAYRVTIRQNCHAPVEFAPVELIVDGDTLKMFDNRRIKLDELEMAERMLEDALACAESRPVRLSAPWGSQRVNVTWEIERV